MKISNQKNNFVLQDAIKKINFKTKNFFGYTINLQTFSKRTRILNSSTQNRRTKSF